MITVNVVSDYGPRLAFRDDTMRVMERMREISATESHIWNRMSIIRLFPAIH